MTQLAATEGEEYAEAVVPEGTSDEINDSSTSRHGDVLFSFSGHAGGIAIESDGTSLVSETVSGTIWHVADDGSAIPLVIIVDKPEGAWERCIGPSSPAGLALSPDGSLFVADSTRHRVCVVSPDGMFRVIAGGANGYRDGPGSEAMFRFPLDVTLAADTCYVADTGNDRIRAISPDGIVTTVAGSIYDYADGRGSHARFRRPGALDVDAEGTCYVADTGNNAIRIVTPDGEVTTLAGMPPGGDGDGSGRDVGLRWPTGIAIDADGSVWVADHGNGALRHINAAGESTTPLALSGLRWPTVVALRKDGAVVIAGAARYDVHVPEACLMVLGDGH